MAPSTPPPVERKRRGLELHRAFAVTDWVTVQHDKRRAANRGLSAAPGIVSRVDEENGTVNLLFPNTLSVFFNRYSPQSRILFAIETHPMAKVRLYEGSTMELNKLLQHALLDFAEMRGKALHNSEALSVEALPSDAVLDATAKVTSPKLESQRIQRGLAEYLSPSSAEVRAHKLKSLAQSPFLSDEQSTCAPSDSEMAISPSIATVRDGQVVPSDIDFAAFTIELAKLLGAEESSTLPKARVKAALGSAYPEWEVHLEELDRTNKILVAEDAIFKL